MKENLQPLKVNLQKGKKQLVIFGDNFPRGMLHKGYAQLKSFPGGTSKKFLYYVETTLKTKKFGAALLHVGVNDTLNVKVKTFLDNLKKIGLKCKSVRVTRILISGTVVKNKLASAYLSSGN